MARAEGRSYEPADVLLARILKERREKSSKGAKYKEPSTPDISGLPALPEGWKWINLGQITWSVRDGPHYSPKYVKEGIPFISGGNVRPNGVDFANAKRITPELHSELSKRCKPEKGDILYTKGGTTGIARVNTYDFEFNVWVHVAVLKLVEPVEPFYVQHSLNSQFCYAQSQRFTHGVGNQDLGLTRMVNIMLGFPPLAEQRRIVAEVERRLSIADGVEKTVGQSIAQAERLRQSILKKAFEGRLVAQDASDEPAGVLLEHIKREKVKFGNKKIITIAYKERKNMEEEIKEIIEVKAEGLYEILRFSKKPVTPKELWHLSKLDIDDFYAELKMEVEKGRIIERRPNDIDVFLELGR
ncbi:MAG: restriction endonuclease subunit S [Candidatus Methanoperedens sp.]